MAKGTPPLDEVAKMKDAKDPESLHLLADTVKQVEPEFVNLGTPSNPLVKKEDMPNPVASKTGSQLLRDNLIK